MGIAGERIKDCVSGDSVRADGNGAVTLAETE